MTAFFLQNSETQKQQPSAFFLQISETEKQKPSEEEILKERRTSKRLRKLGCTATHILFLPSKFIGPLPFGGYHSLLMVQSLLPAITGNGALTPASPRKGKQIKLALAFTIWRKSLVVDGIFFVTCHNWKFP
jgi:hypothetical protein